MDRYITTSHHITWRKQTKKLEVFGMGFLLLNTDEEGSVWDLGIKHTNFKKGKKEEAERGSPRGIGIYGFSVMCLLG